jgi:hypothetical protein
MKTLEEIAGQMAPEEAMLAISRIVRRLFPYADERSRMEFLNSLVGDDDLNAASGLVHR